MLAFFFGYSLTMLPLIRSGLASDTFSITVMKILDSAIVLVIPGAMEARLASPPFRGSLAFALAFVASFPVNRYLIARGRGHAVVHQYHGGGHEGHNAHRNHQPTGTRVEHGRRNNSRDRCVAGGATGTTIGRGRLVAALPSRYSCAMGCPARRTRRPHRQSSMGAGTTSTRWNSRLQRTTGWDATPDPWPTLITRPSSS